MGAQTKFDRLQDEFFDVQISAAHAFACIRNYNTTHHEFLLEIAAEELKRCSANHYLAELDRINAVDEHLLIRELRADRKQLQLL